MCWAGLLRRVTPRNDDNGVLGYIAPRNSYNVLDRNIVSHIDYTGLLRRVAPRNDDNGTQLRCSSQ